MRTMDRALLTLLALAAALPAAGQTAVVNVDANADQRQIGRAHV